MGALGQRTPPHIRALDKTLCRACSNARRNRSRTAV